MFDNIITPEACGDFESLVRTTVFEIVMKTVNRKEPVHTGKTRKDLGITTKDSLSIGQLKAIVNTGNFGEYEVELADVKEVFGWRDYRLILKDTYTKGNGKVANRTRPLTRRHLDALWVEDKTMRANLTHAIRALETVLDAKQAIKAGYKAQFAQTVDTIQVEKDNDFFMSSFKTVQVDLADKGFSPLDIKQFGLSRGDLVRYVMLDEAEHSADEQCHLGGYYHSVKVFDSGAEPKDWGSNNQVFLNVSPQNLEYMRTQTNVYYCPSCQKNHSPSFLAKNGNKCPVYQIPRSELVAQTVTLRLPEITVGVCNTDSEGNKELKTGLRMNTYGGVHFTSARFNKSSGLFNILKDIKNKRLEPQVGIEAMLNTSFKVRKQITGVTKFESASVVPVLFETSYGEFLGLALKRDSLTMA